MAIYDKNAIMQVIGGLLHNPLLFCDIGVKGLNENDFDCKLTKSIFNSICNLYKLGADRITIVDIDNYLRSYEVLYANFNDKQGLSYLNDCYDLAKVENFRYYYNRVKKFSALNALIKSGIDIKEIYNEDEDDCKKSQKQMETFDAMSVEDIFQFFDRKLSKIQYGFNVFNSNNTEAECHIYELKEELKKNPEIGRPLQGVYYNSIVRGARKGKFYLNSGSSGSGKSREAVGNACHLAYPYFYVPARKGWVKNGGTEKTLILTTELQKDEVQTIVLAYLSGVNEEKILYGSYSGDEEARVDYAIQIMRDYPNLFIEAIPDPNITLIQSIVKRNIAVHQIVNLFYDYIFSSTQLLGEFRDLGLRQDSILILLATALKDLATENNIFVASSTQLSGDYENWKGVRNQTLLRDAKGIIDKADIGCITMKVRDEDLSMLSKVLKQKNLPNPTHVRDIYKARRGRYSNVRIWSIFDLGTARIEDLFVTDGNYIPIPITTLDVIFAEDDDMDIAAEMKGNDLSDVTKPKKNEWGD